MRTKYRVWVKTALRTWEPTGDAPMTEKIASVKASNLRRDGQEAHILPVEESELVTRSKSRS